MKNLLIKTTLLTFVLSVNMASAAYYTWNSSGADKSFTLGANWTPVVANPIGEVAPSFLIGNYETLGAPVINSSITLNNGYVQIGAANYGVLNMTGGYLYCRNILCGYSSGGPGIFNMYGGNIYIHAVDGNRYTSGSISSPKAGIINFYGGTIVAQNYFGVGENSKIYFYNAGAYEIADGATYAPIFAQRYDTASAPITISLGEIHVSLAKGLNLSSGSVIYLVEYNGTGGSYYFKNQSNGSTMNIDGFNFRLETNRLISTGRYAIALVALQAVDTRPKKGAMIILSSLSGAFSGK